MTPLSVLALLLLVGISLGSYFKGYLDVWGSTFSSLFGVFVFFVRGPETLLMFIGFYFVTIIASLSGRARKRLISPLSAQRTSDNVLSNGFVPAMGALFSYNFLFLGAMAGALADTLSSEMGVLSNRRPRDILTFRPVPLGKNGGVTVLGLIFSLVGGSFVALFAFFLHILPLSFVSLFLLTLSGFLGSLIDSVLGSVLENHNELSNGSVNFITTLFAGVLAHYGSLLLIG